MHGLLCDYFTIISGKFTPRTFPLKATFGNYSRFSLLDCAPKDEAHYLNNRLLRRKYNDLHTKQRRKEKNFFRDECWWSDALSCLEVARSDLFPLVVGRGAADKRQWVERFKRRQRCVCK